jgi:YVTN family beta-propeller protein
MRYMNRKMGLLVLFAAITILFFISGTHYQSATLGPLDLVASSDGQLLYIAQNKAKRIDVFNVETEQIVHRIPIEAKPTGLTVDEDKEVLYVTVGQGEGKICVINLRNNKLEYSFPAGHSPMSPQTREQDNRLYICNRFANKISVIDPEKQRVIKSLAVPREPIALKITPDNKWLLVANHLNPLLHQK